VYTGWRMSVPWNCFRRLSLKPDVLANWLLYLVFIVVHVFTVWKWYDAEICRCYGTETTLTTTVMSFS